MATLKKLETIADDAVYISLANYKIIRELILEGINFVDDLQGIIASQHFQTPLIDGDGGITGENLIELFERIPTLKEKLVAKTSFVMDYPFAIREIGRNYDSTIKL